MSPGSFPCRFCGTALNQTFVDLGVTPLCQTVVKSETYWGMEPFYPLHAFVCEECFLVQVDEFVPTDSIFSEYAYFSSYADSWVEHARRYCEDMRDKLGLNENSTVVEVGSNDGYLLQHFVKMGIPCYGIEPAANVAKDAVKKGVPTEVAFFGSDVAERMIAEDRGADLILGKNVMAQVPQLNDFVAGLRIMMRPSAVVTIEFPHLLTTMEGNQFDQVYHEHYFYFSLLAAKRIFAHHGITIFDVEEVPTHGGSLRIYGCRDDDVARQMPSERMIRVEQREHAAGLHKPETYAAFAEQVRETKRAALDFLISKARAGKTVAAYGAPGKGNTFLNYCGIKTDLIAYTVDRNPYKQGTFLPGSRIPVYSPEKIAETKPDVIVVLPWNLADEIAEQLAYTAEWGAELVAFVPSVRRLKLPEVALSERLTSEGVL
ncbi:MAG: class I SAM-dependent methyltransferase [Pseudomonadota bacterium]